MDILNNLPQIIYVALILAGLFLSAYNHGKEKTGKENFFVSFVSAVIVLILLFWGGFFK